MGRGKRFSSTPSASGRGRRQFPHGPGDRRVPGAQPYLSDRRLVPRMKEYLSDCGSQVVDVGEMALALQAQYSEYGRKKKVAFRNLVAKAYKSMRSEVSVESRLQQMEKAHLRRRVALAEEEGVGSSDLESSQDGSSSDSEEDFEANLLEGYNMMNDSLLQVYNSGPNSNPAAQESDSHSHSNTSPFQDDIDFADLDSSETAPGNGRGQKDTTEQQNEREIQNEISQTVAIDGVTVNHAVQEAICTRPDPQQTDGGGGLSDGVQRPIVEGHSGGRSSQIDAVSAAAAIQKTPPVKRVTFDPEVTESREGGEKGKRRDATRRPMRKGSSSLKRPPSREVVEGEGVEGGSGEQRRQKRRRVGSGEGKTSADSAVKEALVEKHSKKFQVERSTVRFSDVGGCDSCLKEVCKLLLHLRHPEVFKKLGVRPPQGFLLHGPPGSGKTLLAHAIAGELAIPFIKLAATEVVSGVSGESEGTIRELFQQAKEIAPCVLFIDEVDAICPKRETAQREMERRIVTQLLACLDDLNQSSSDAHVLVIGATNRPDSLDPALRRAGRFDREISLGIPNERARESILQVLCRSLRLEEGFSFTELAHLTPGFVGADLMALVREASLCAVSRVLREAGVDGETGGERCGEGEGTAAVVQQLREQPSLTDKQLEDMYITGPDFTAALCLVQPSAKREGFVTVPDTTWEDVGALEDIREELNISILAPVRYPRQFASLGLASPPGVLLAGPPGCGKTLLAKAIANESGINFISVKGPELLNMYVGESERAVRQVFQRARSSAPCVIFFDELDALCPRRSEVAETSASARVVNQLLTEMDGLESRRQVFVMGATNRPDIIDPAVMRPGRLDKVLYVGLPSSSDRAAILRTITKDGTKPTLDPDVDLATLASNELCSRFSGADLSALVREAAISALREHMQLSPLQMVAPDQSDHFSTPVVARRHFLTALRKIKPSVSEKDEAFYEEMAAQYCHR